jgi:2-polyprenyl-3-methyl-5-hydroxy-6-metoxy-1,4-benzoquinol methylase
MKDTFNGWKKIDKEPLQKVIDLVITNGTVESVNPDTHLYHLFGDEQEPLKILDFGCGICRNTCYMSMTYPHWNVYGYDNDNMLKHAHTFCNQKYSISLYKQSNLTLTSNWEQLKTQKFDVIFASLVFQHIYEDNLSVYLQDMRKMTKKLIVSGRRFNDEMIDGKYKNTWEIFENNGYYPSNANEISYKKYGDLEEHSLCIYNFD